MADVDLERLLSDHPRDPSEVRAAALQRALLQLLQTDPRRLTSLLYRLDVDEEAVLRVRQEALDIRAQAADLARLIALRLSAKCRTTSDYCTTRTGKAYSAWAPR